MTLRISLEVCGLINHGGGSVIKVADHFLENKGPYAGGRNRQQKLLYCLTPFLVFWSGMASDPPFYTMSGICISARGGYTSYTNRYPDPLPHRNLFGDFSDFAKVGF